ncbi:MAG: type II toxin-antitoxin system HicB family antitoxin [Candidatus Korobacteraceae bacterium]|jgi:predicted RNase H-like HicB family nuclease
MPVHEEVLAAANRIAGQRKDWTFTPDEIIRALPNLNEYSVRTDIVSRCCVNAPPNHLRRWDYFRRISRGKYEVISKYRTLSGATPSVTARASSRPLGESLVPIKRDVIHAVVHPDEDGYYVECLEVAVVTQGDNLDDLVRNLDEALSLHLEGEDLAALGLSSHPQLQLIIEKPLAL